MQASGGASSEDAYFGSKTCTGGCSIHSHKHVMYGNSFRFLVKICCSVGISTQMILSVTSWCSSHN